MKGTRFFNIASNFNKGFTLLEVMVSMGILAIAFIALLGLRGSNIRAVEEAERLSQAALIIERLMGEIELAGLDGKKKEGVEEGYRWEATLTPTPIEPLKELRLTLWWDKEKTIEVVEYIP